MSRLPFVLLSISMLGVLYSSAQIVPVEKVRDLFFAIGRSNGAALQLYKSLEKADLSKDPLLMAYRGASLAASAGSASGVWNKLGYFNRGKNELEKAVSLNPLDAEIRFLRLATEVNAPGFLGYTGDREKDKAFIIHSLGLLSFNHPNAYLYLRICRFLMAQADLNPNEKSTVNCLIEKFNPKN